MNIKKVNELNVFHKIGNKIGDFKKDYYSEEDIALKIIEELGQLNFFKRVFKLREISAEKLAVQKELLERERNANAVGSTWVKENGKYRKYNAFAEYVNSLSSQARDYYNSVTTAFGGFVRW